MQLYLLRLQQWLRGRYLHRAGTTTSNCCGVACTILATFPLKVTTMSALSLLKFEPRITVSEPGKPEFGEIEAA